ncbi:unnamed protein product [Didymodactylos carnosus]|uniref:Uncharacterized protein n=1 Tax=Didymodactylos carnosus TaxID=1234261 RepID=A0A814T748_9BILA|nr:unnamed protein product [Didymodactylos carnosus]CAF1354872.1 unnamed protein product [Didymodactylos carnosus]CAF3921429.1 unnamed protein product [Didymodactylos carnosus]CAF4165251.1 unnamed protein product [Didymodactylos carnosus]
MPTPSSQTLSMTKNDKSRISTNNNRTNGSHCKQSVIKESSVRRKTTTPTMMYYRQRSTSAPLNISRTKSMINNKNDKSVVNIHINGPEITLLPAEEQAVRKMYQKLQQLQPDGVCVELNTLRRALYPPTVQNSLITNQNERRLSVERVPTRPWASADDELSNKYKINLQNVQNDYRAEAMKQEETERKKLENLDYVYQQVKKHAEINYSYYTRTNK